MPLQNQSLPPAIVSSLSPTKPTVILLAGLQGSGKTTFAAKLSNYLQTEEIDTAKTMEIPKEKRDQMLPNALPKTNRKVLLAACDVYRPAAVDQLKILAKKLNVPVYEGETEEEVGNAVLIAKNAIERAKEVRKRERGARFGLNDERTRRTSEPGRRARVPDERTRRTSEPGR